MGNIFAGSEVVEIGIQIEKNGKAFYDTLSGQTTDQKAKDLFTFLAEEEERHIDAFQKLLDSVRKYEPPQAFTEEYFAYMKALASDHVFTQENKGTEIAKKIKSDTEALETAIGFEKDSIVFYEGMTRMVLGHDLKTVQNLILQEQGHLAKLSELKKNL